MSPLHLIRLAMLSGVLMFGAVVYYLRSSGSAPGPATPAAALGYAGGGLWAIVLVGTFLVWRARQTADAHAKVRQWSIIGYAMGEAVALFGGVVWLLSGSPTWYFPGLLFLLITFVLFPAQKV